MKLLWFFSQILSGFSEQGSNMPFCGVPKGLQQERLTSQETFGQLKTNVLGVVL